MDGIFSKDEADLIAAARMILSDGVERLKGREGLFPTNRTRTRADRAECRSAREALTDKLVADYGSLRYEVAVAVLIDAQGRLIAIEQFPQGKANRVEVSARILAGFIMAHGASAVLLAHNHPSGDNTPSTADVKLTEMYSGWLKIMEVDLIDHLVLNGQEASSIVGCWL
jgi:DNA repair protein RadC